MKFRTGAARALPALALMLCVFLLCVPGHASGKGGTADSDEGFSGNCSNPTSTTCPIVIPQGSETFTGAQFSVTVARYYWCSRGTPDPNFPLAGAPECQGAHPHYIVQITFSTAIGTLQMRSVLLNEVAVNPSYLQCNSGGIQDGNGQALCTNASSMSIISYVDSSRTRWDFSGVSDGGAIPLVMDDQASLVDTNFLVTAIDSATGTAYTVGALVRGISPTAATNDAFANAITVSGSPYTATLDLSSATMGAGDPVPSCTGGTPTRSVWFKFTFTSSKFVEISTAGSGFDTKVDVVTGSPGSFVQVACNDDSSASNPGPSSLSFTASANVTYYVMVEDYVGGTDNVLAISIKENPQLTFSPASLTFPATNVNVTSAALTVTLGAVNGTVSSIVLATSNIEFFVSSTTCGTSLAAGSTCTISVKFNPSGYGARTGNIVVTSNSPASPQYYPVSGTGNGAGSTYATLQSTGHSNMTYQSFNSITFPDVLVGSSTGTRSICPSCVLSGIGGADLNRDARADIVVGYNSGSPHIGVFLSNGDMSWAAAANHGGSLVNPSSIAFADVNKDGYRDILYPDISNNQIYVWYGPSFSSFATFPTTLIYNPTSIFIADFNKDGIPDVLAAGNDNLTGDYGAQVFLSNSSGTFGGPTTSVTMSMVFGNPLSVAVGDFDGDGNLDFAMAEQGATQGGLFFGNGGGAFVSSSFQMPLNEVAGKIVAGDFDKNGHAGIVVDDEDTQTLCLVTVASNRSKTVQPVAKIYSGVGDMQVADVTGDGYPDLLVADGLFLRVRPGNGFGATEQDVYQGTGTLPRFAAADFNGNLHPGVAFGGLGSGNTVVVLPSGANGGFALSQTIRLTNSGNVALTISSIAIPGGNGTFPISHNCPISPSTLAVNGTCTITVNFAPPSVGQFSQTLTISDNGVGSPHQIPLGGKGVLLKRRRGQVTSTQ